MSAVLDALAALLWLVFVCGAIALVLVVVLFVAFLIDSARSKRP